MKNFENKTLLCSSINSQQNINKSWWIPAKKFYSNILLLHQLCLNLAIPKKEATSMNILMTFWCDFVFGIFHSYPSVSTPENLSTISRKLERFFSWLTNFGQFINSALCPLGVMWLTGNMKGSILSMIYVWSTKRSSARQKITNLYFCDPFCPSVCMSSGRSVGVKPNEYIQLSFRWILVFLVYLGW